MALWPSNPAWIPLTLINNNNQYEAGDGVRSSDINKIVENLLALYNTTTGVNVQPGVIITNTVSHETPASVELTTFEDAGIVYLNFTFNIPESIGIPDAPSDGKVYGRKDNVWVEAVPKAPDGSRNLIGTDGKVAPEYLPELTSIEVIVDW